MHVSKCFADFHAKPAILRLWHSSSQCSSGLWSTGWTHHWSSAVPRTCIVILASWLIFHYWPSLADHSSALMDSLQLGSLLTTHLFAALYFASCWPDSFLDLSAVLVPHHLTVADLTCLGLCYYWHLYLYFPYAPVTLSGVLGLISDSSKVCVSDKHVGIPWIMSAVDNCPTCPTCMKFLCSDKMFHRLLKRIFWFWSQMQQC